jgi:hypothetical protein
MGMPVRKGSGAGTNAGPRVITVEAEVVETSTDRTRQGQP